MAITPTTKISMDISQNELVVYITIKNRFISNILIEYTILN
ncbi:hypothetical protein [Romboutsia sp. MSSM.1001216sp_RTP31141st1_G3_RTP31141_220114]